MTLQRKGFAGITSPRMRSPKLMGSRTGLQFQNSLSSEEEAETEDGAHRGGAESTSTRGSGPGPGLPGKGSSALGTGGRAPGPWERGRSGLSREEGVGSEAKDPGITLNLLQLPRVSDLREVCEPHLQRRSVSFPRGFLRDTRKRTFNAACHSPGRAAAEAEVPVGLLITCDRWHRPAPPTGVPIIPNFRSSWMQQLKES